MEATTNPRLTLLSNNPTEALDRAETAHAALEAVIDLLSSAPSRTCNDLNSDSMSSLLGLISREMGQALTGLCDRPAKSQR